MKRFQTRQIPCLLLSEIFKGKARNCISNIFVKFEINLQPHYRPAETRAFPINVSVGTTPCFIEGGNKTVEQRKMEIQLQVQAAKGHKIAY